MDWETLKGFIVPFLVRWILKIGAGFILSLGISTGSATEVITAIVMAVVGIVMSLVNHKTAIETPPPKP
jgi:hypothetical protein